MTGKKLHGKFTLRGKIVACYAHSYFLTNFGKNQLFCPLQERRHSTEQNTMRSGVLIIFL
jgi:hypothetical protein